jgi:hypothetical protein
MSGPALQSARRMQVQTALLGATFMHGIVYPLARAVIPLLLQVVGIGTFLIRIFMKLDSATGGWLSTVLVVTTVLTGIVLLIRSLIGVYRAFNAILKVNAAIQAFITALQGPGGIAKVLAATAVTGVIIGSGAYALNHLGEGNDAKNSKEEKFDRSIDKFGDIVDRMQENWTRYNRGGIPAGLSGYDIVELQRRMYLGTIG